MIPLEYTNMLSAFTRQDEHDANPPHYSVTVSWGSRLEPRIVDVAELKVQVSDAFKLISCPAIAGIAVAIIDVIAYKVAKHYKV